MSDSIIVSTVIPTSFIETCYYVVEDGKKFDLGSHMLLISTNDGIIPVCIEIITLSELEDTTKCVYSNINVMYTAATMFGKNDLHEHPHGPYEHVDRRYILYKHENGLRNETFWFFRSEESEQDIELIKLLVGKLYLNSVPHGTKIEYLDVWQPSLSAKSARS